MSVGLERLEATAWQGTRVSPKTSLSPQKYCCSAAGNLLTTIAVSVYIENVSAKTPLSTHIPSKHAGSDSRPIRISLAASVRSGPDDSCPPACFRTGSYWPKSDTQPEPNRVRAGFSQYDPGRLWRNAAESGRGEMVAGRFAFCQNRAR